MKTLTTEQIKARLQEVGMTQKQLAEKLEMQPARLSEMLNGKREAPEDVEGKVMDALGITVYEFPDNAKVKKSVNDPFGPSKNNESEEELQADARQFAQDQPIINEINFHRANAQIGLLESIVEMIQTRRYLGLRHKKRLIEDLKGLEL